MFASWELALIHECRAGRLATIAPDGRPATVPVCYAESGGRLAIPVDEKPKQGRKLARIRNIERDPRVSLLIDRYDDDWTRLAWVRIDGEASVHDRGDAWTAALNALRDRYHQYRDMRLEELPLVEIQPSRVVSWRWQGDDE